MKKKISISLNKTILSKIDKNVKLGYGKNRSSVIESILREKFGNFTDVSAVVFAHDYKWDNRAYPFSEPKVFLKVRWKTLVERQIEIFKKVGIKHIIFSVSFEDKEFFEKELKNYEKDLSLEFIEVGREAKTWEVLRKIMKKYELSNDIVISNWDIYYWSLDLEKYYNYHKEQKSDFSLCLKFVLNPEQLGNVKINWNKILEFVERPKASQMNLTNSGLYITTKKFLEENDFWDYLEVDFFPKLPSICNNTWYIYSWEWEHIQNDSAYERANGWLM